MKNTTPEPELNVKTEKLKQSIIGRLRMYSDAGTWEEDESVRVIVALIQQVSDQRVREFVEKLKTEAWPVQDVIKHGAGCFVSVSNITYQLTDYLSHKEARDGK